MSLTVIQGTTPTPCVCCEVECITGTFGCETNGGLATLCGFDEFTTPSTPPKKYRRNSISEDVSGCTYLVPTCSAPDAANFRYSIGGSAVYDLETCVLTETTLTINTDIAPCAPTSANPVTSSVSRLYFEPTFMQEDFITQTQRQCSARAGCYQYNFGPDAWATASGGASEELSDEDTEDDAIARLLASSGWTGCAGIPCCLAQYEERTSGFSFNYQDARWSITASGLIPSKHYSTVVEYWRRPYGTGSYTLFQTDMVNEQADASGNINFTGDVPNELGFQTYAVQGACPS